MIINNRLIFFRAASRSSFSSACKTMWDEDDVVKFVGIGELTEELDEFEQEPNIIKGEHEDHNLTAVTNFWVKYRELAELHVHAKVERAKIGRQEIAELHANPNTPPPLPPPGREVPLFAIRLDMTKWGAHET